MITAAQLRAARALAGLDQRRLAELSGLSLPTIQRMETSEDLIRGNVDSLTKLIAALDGVGVELIGVDQPRRGTRRSIEKVGQRPPRSWGNRRTSR
jgi:transcriptional regulator with XRE-family HTH domain